MIVLRKVSETQTTITLGWDTVAGAVGYRFTVDGKISHTFDPTRTEVKVAKGADRVLVEALGVTDSGVWPTAPPPAPYTVTQNVVGSGGAVSGTFGWAATPSDVAATAKVEFLVDGTVKATDTSSPYQHSLDTTTLANGVRTWTVRATAADGRVATDDEQVTVNNTTSPPPPPPSGVLFDGRFDTGDFSRWPNHEMLSAATVVDTPHGKVMRAQTSGSLSEVNVGQNFEDYQLPWEIIPADVWHRFGILLPSGNNPAYPGTFVRSTPGDGWDMFWELHDRTDPQSGYNIPSVPWYDPSKPTTPGSYGSTMVTVQGTATDLHWQIRMAGNTLTNPVNTFFSLPEQVQRDRWYIHDVRVKHGQTAATGFAEWWVDGVKRWEQACPTAFVCADGKSGERLQAGIYRGVFSGTTTVYLDGVVVTSARQA